MQAGRFLTRAPLRYRVLLAVSSGVLLVLALPKPDFHYLSWIALIPLLLVVSNQDRAVESLGLGYTAGVAQFGGTCYWIVTTMATYGGLSMPLSVAVFVLFVAVFALHTGLFVWLMRSHLIRFGDWGLLLAAPTWVAIELVQSYLIFGGFPWMLAGYGLVPFRGLLQITTWTGIYGLSFVLVGLNSLVAHSIRTRRLSVGIPSAAVVLMAILWPGPAAESSEDSLALRLVQTNIDIEQSWMPADRARLMAELEDLSMAGAGAPELVVWPETPAPFYLNDGGDFERYVAHMAESMDAHVLVGYIGQGDGHTNSAGIVSPAGELVSRYDKIHLVPFGEYVPLKSLLFFAESLVRNVGDFRPGSEYTISSLDSHEIATTICYEDVFPGLIRQFTRRGAEIIVNITNDGWFGESSAPYQHLRMSRVRAVENRRYLVRAANTGISAIVDPYGDIVARTLLGTRTILDGDAGYRSDLTVYVRYGDVFAYVMTALVLASFLAVRGGRGKVR